MTSEIVEIALEAAQSGGNILTKYWGTLTSYEQKSSASDLVTVADKESEAAIIKLIKSKFPNHSILAEESGLENQSNEFMWYIDPLDGTTNYAHQYPTFSVSIACYQNNMPLVGVVYNPLTNERFFATKGGGATLNGKPIRVSKVDNLSQSLLATGFAYDRLKTPETNYKEFTHFTQLTQGVRRAGSAALDLAFVACGRLDGYWERGLQAWDMAAGLLLVTEAGGLVSNYDQSQVDINSGRILSSNGLIHLQISEQLLNLRQSP